MKSNEGKTTIDEAATSWGIFLAFVSGLTYSIGTAIVKYVHSIHPAQLLIYRFFASTAFALPQFVFLQKGSLWPLGFRISISYIMILCPTGIFFHFVAFRYLPVGEAAALISCYPAFVAVSGRIFMNESLGLVQVVSLLTTMGGMVFVTGVYQALVENSRAYTTENVYGLLAGLTSIPAACAYVLLMRKLKNIHSSIILINSGVIGMIEGVVITVVLDGFRLHHAGLQQSLIILLGISSFVANISLIVATQYAEAGPVSIMRAASDIFFSFLWQVILFHDVPDPLTIFGAILVCVSVVLIGFNKKINELFAEKCLTFCYSSRKFRIYSINNSLNSLRT